MKPRVLDVILVCASLLVITGVSAYANVSETTRQGVVKELLRLCRYVYEDMTGTSERDSWD